MGVITTNVSLVRSVFFQPFVASITSVNDDEGAAVALLIVLEEGGSDLFYFSSSLTVRD